MNKENVTRNLGELNIDDGSERIPIKNKFGDEIGVFYFQPTDTRIIDRYNEAIVQFEKIVEPLISINNKDIQTPEQFASVLQPVEEELFKLFDYVFNGNLGEAFFKRVSPFTLVGGSFYCELVLESVGALIADRIGVSVKKLNQRIKKHTHGYQSRTGKHKDGKI